MKSIKLATVTAIRKVLIIFFFLIPSPLEGDGASRAGEGAGEVARSH